MKLHHKIADTGTLLSLVLMISAVIIQVFTRLFLESAPPWTEEAARICFIYVVAFGTGIGIRNGDFIKLDILDTVLSSHQIKKLWVFNQLIVLVFSFILIFQSLRFIHLGMDEQSPALKLSMGLVFISILVIGLSIAIFTLEHFASILKKKNNTLS